jgi:hypothetical protein
LREAAITLVRLSGVGSQLLLSSYGTTALILVRSLAANYPTTIARPEEIRVFRPTPKVIFFSIARTGFGHMDLVML